MGGNHDGSSVETAHVGANEEPLSSRAPRAYQLEMLEESLRQNIIVTVRHSYTKTLTQMGY